MLNDINFKEVIKNTTLFAFDFIIKNENNEILLGMRNNKPAEGYWFVPGGRVLKNEDLNDAMKRILFNELGLIIDNFEYLNNIGLYNHIYDENFFNDNSFNTHYIVYVVEMKLKTNLTISLDSQHHTYIFATEQSLLDNEKVHQYVKNYFLKSPDNKLHL